MGNYNSDPNVMTLATAVAQNSDVKGKLWSRLLEVGANTKDDFAMFEGETDSDKPFWRRQDLKADGGDKVVFSTIGEASGPGARGEVELTGRTSKAHMGAYTAQVDYFRDAVEVTKKQIKFLAAGKSLETVLMGMLSRKMGRKRMYDMMHCLFRTTNATFFRPNNRTSRDTIRHTDVLTPSFLVEGQARLQGIGAKPINVSKSKSGSEVWRYMVFAGQAAMTDIRNSTSYQNALLQAQARSDENPLFTGRLVDWQGMALFEHIVVDPDTNDPIGSPILPKAKLGTAITAANTTFVLAGGINQTTHPNTLSEYFRDFPGYDYLFTEDQTADPDANTYYFWVLNITGGSAGKAGFYAYTGSANTGNTIGAVTARLRAAASGIAATTVGNITWDSTYHTDSHPVGSVIIPANAYGVPIGRSFIFGAGAALRPYGSVKADPIYQDRDYKFVKGMGYEGIWGQRAALDTQNVPRGYMVLEHAVEHPGLVVPYNAS